MENKDPIFLITFFRKYQLLVSVHKVLWTDFTLTFKCGALYLITGGLFVVLFLLLLALKEKKAFYTNEKLSHHVHIFKI